MIAPAATVFAAPGAVTGYAAIVVAGLMVVLWLIALTAGGTWWTLIGPVVMSVLLIRVSGAALLERDMAKRRPQYADYIKRTTAFFPWPPRKDA